MVLTTGVRLVQLKLLSGPKRRPADQCGDRTLAQAALRPPDVGSPCGSHSRSTEADIPAVRALIDRLVSETTAVARFDGSTHAAFVAAAMSS